MNAPLRLVPCNADGRTQTGTRMITRRALAQSRCRPSVVMHCLIKRRKNCAAKLVRDRRTEPTHAHASAQAWRCYYLGMKPRALILRTAGTNCDAETAHAFELAGATSVAVHLNELLRNPRQMGEFQLLAIPGGFSYGDDIAAGRIFANRLTHYLRDALHDFVSAGKPIIGICNGFQVLVQTDLLPGPLPGIDRRACTLAPNANGRFIDRWVYLAPRGNKCIWTGGLNRTIELPIAHGEGRFVPASESARQALWDANQVALVYAQQDGTPAKGTFPENPNGSVDAIAGICDSSGLVLGLMPHPERHVSRLHHYAWTGQSRHSAQVDGLEIFMNAVHYVGGREPGVDIEANNARTVDNSAVG